MENLQTEEFAWSDAGSILGREHPERRSYDRERHQEELDETESVAFDVQARAPAGPPAA